MHLIQTAVHVRIPGGGSVSSAMFTNAIGSNPFNLPLLNNGTGSNAGGLGNLNFGVNFMGNTY